MANDKLYFLSKVDLLSDLSPQELASLADDFKWQEYPKDSVIIYQGQECHWFYILTAGKAEALLTKPGNRSLHMNYFNPGDTFGEISLATGKGSPNQVCCIEDCKVLALDAEHFARMLLRWPFLYQRFAVKLSQILNTVNSGLWAAKHKEYLRSALELTQYEYKFYGVWGSPKTTKEVENRIQTLAQGREHLLIIGERGTGRQMVAWFLHKARFPESAPFVVVDGRLFDQQWGSDLTTLEGQSAPAQGANFLEMSEGGTLFIRDLNLVSPRTQLALVETLLHTQQVCIIGSIQAGSESELVPDLHAAFSQTFTIAPLRERKRDIPVIAQGVLDKLAQQNNRQAPTLSQEATKLLLSHNYRQGNVTELIRVMERAFFLAENDTIGLEHVFFGPAAESLGGKFNLLSWKWFKSLIKESNFILWAQRLTSLVFLSIISLLIFAPQAVITGNIFVLVWGLWWPALAIISPFLGRLWCTVCPFSYVMEAVQKKLHLNHPVPDWLKKHDYILVTLLFLLIFWIEDITRMRTHPGYTAILLLSIQTAALLTGIVFTRHTWCRHLCPLGGFVGLASIGSLLEVRSDSTYCLNKCTTYECYKGTNKLSGCPMSQHAPFLDNNLDCKLCFHCVRNCPNGEVQVNLRIPAREIWHLVRVNQGYALFIGACLTILLPINYFERFYGIWPVNSWLLWFSLAYWGSALVGGSITWLLARPFRTKAASKQIKLIFACIPLVLAGHIMYQLHFIPGATSLMLGFGMKVTNGIAHPYFFSALTLLRILASFIGLGLTIFCASMILHHQRSKGHL